jgi:hypothetical protein
MTTFRYAPDADNTDRVYVLVDDVFDVSLLRKEEGLIIDVWEHERELLGTLAIDNPSTEGV